MKKSTEIPSPEPLELLAPARDLATAIAAIDHGADAVYIGSPSHGARRQAANSIEDIRQLTDYAHRFHAQVYVTVNTIVYDDELAEVEHLVWQLYAAGVDALIVQDMALLCMKLPPIALHASTQCDIRTPGKARFLRDAGFSQLVLPRELTLDEISEMHRAVDVPLEAFVHGALCVSFSGDCQASFALTGRSANRGECAQICRLPFDLEDKEGNKLLCGKHLLSLKDLNRSAQLADMADAGVRSFKIEGRLKDDMYVRNVVAAYRRALDSLIAANPGKYCRSSLGRESFSFTPQLSKSFNRGFTPYFLTDRRPKESMASMDSPKWIGEPVATVAAALSPRKLKIRGRVPLANGDGLGFFNKVGKFVGFRMNKVEGNVIHTATDVAVQPGAVLYRNSSKEWNDLFAKKTATRSLPVEASIDYRGGAAVLEMKVEDTDISAVVTLPCKYSEARSPQTEGRRNTMAKLGDTEFDLTGFSDHMANLFIPMSQLAALRRAGVEALRSSVALALRTGRRSAPAPDFSMPEGYSFSRHDNIANHLAAEFYAEHSGGRTDSATLPKAIETDSAALKSGELRVMQTRYCLRRELGACLRTPQADKLPSPLFLTAPGVRLRLDFRCRECMMDVIRI